jgi:transposase
MWYTNKLNIFSPMLTFSRDQPNPMNIFLDLPEVQIEGVDVAEEITLTLHTTSAMASCPSCGTQSSHIQSRSTRTLRDLPSGGRPIRLIMHVRRFFCKKRTCAQKIFAERLPTLCRPHAQRTQPLQEALCQLGLRVGGQAGADVGSDTSHQRKSRYHLAPGSPIAFVCSIRTTHHWSRRLGTQAQTPLWNPHL